MSRKREKKLAAARRRAKEHQEKLQRQAQPKRKEQKAEEIDPLKRKQVMFSKIYEMYKNDVYKISLYYTLSEEGAEEVTQKVFFNFYIHFEDVKQEKVLPYLLRSSRNMSLNWVRDRKKLRNGQIVELTDDLAIVSVEDVYIREEEQRLALVLSDSILSRLYEANQIWYETVMLTCYLGKQNIQVAKELGVSKDVINSRLYRARQWIKENFREEYEKVKDDLY